MADKNISPKSHHSKTPQPQPSTSAAMEKPAKNADKVLPLTKVKAIMKSSPEIENIGADTVQIVAKATELFIEHLTKKSHEKSNFAKTIDYRHLSEFVQGEDHMDFLHEIIPCKITGKAALLEMEKQNVIMNKEILE